MSASLVGSEMCIRDRDCGSGLGLRSPGLRAQSSDTGSDCQPRLQATELCLLYTSDAADDM
eukprot:11163087-Alexandrium_andersonii.AAC.1